MASFDLLAAVDLRGGQVVRLREGDFARETSYSDDPAAVARAFVDRGVRWLHVVDLDGARAGERMNTDAIAGIEGAVSGRASVEVGGGLRTLEAVSDVLDAAAARAVVGSAAIADPTLAAQLVSRHGADRIAVAIDVRGGAAVGQAWQAGASGAPLEGVIPELVGAGVTWFEVTAIERDGSLEGPDLDLLQRVLGLAPAARVIASGGIRHVDDVLATAAIGCAGAIVGRALYEGNFDLAAALRVTTSG